MLNFAPDYAVGELVRCHPSWARVFEQYGIDYCCGGNRSLNEACEARGIDFAMLERAEHSPAQNEDVDWYEVPLQALVGHIVEKHHTYLRRELPRLAALSVELVEKYGRENGAFKELSAVFAALQEELAKHMRKEETALFPWVCEMESNRWVDSARCVTVRKPIRVMKDEHRFAGDALARVRWLANDFVPPPNACPTVQALYAGLEELECDLLRHIHEENNMLFPRAIELEAQLAQ